MAPLFKSDILGKRASRRDSFANLVPIEAAYFYPGMHIDFNIYLRVGKTFSLLCGDVTLDDELIGRIDATEDQGNLICVTRTAYKKLILNAARLAEEDGNEIDWDAVHEAADNPKSIEEYMSESDSPVFEADDETRRRVENNTATKIERIAVEAEDAILSTDTGVTTEDGGRMMSKAEFEARKKAMMEARKEAEEKKKTEAGAVSDQDNKNPDTDSQPQDTQKTDGVTQSQDQVIMVGTDGEPISPQQQKEIAHTVEKVRKYRGVNDSISDLIHYSSRNYTVRIKDAREIAENLVTLVRTTKTEIIFQCMNSLDRKNNYLATHTQNVAAMNIMIAAWLELSRAEQINLAIVGLMSDLGKQQVADKVLKKPGKLSPEEFEMMKLHTVHSYNIAVASGITDKSILSGIRNHHERLNGTGYPDGLYGDEISLYARITAISDIYDAMVTGKSYKEGHSQLEIMSEFSENRFSDLDNKIVNLVLDELSNIFINKQVVLSNGRTGRIVSLNSSDYAYPIVQVGKEYIKTNKHLKVVQITNFVPVK